MSRSADLAFGNIARQMGFVQKERLHQAMPMAYQRGISLEQLLVETGDLNPEQWGKIIQIRMRFGRKCGSCTGVTYLMGAIPQCEHCGGALQLQPGDEQPGVRGESGSHRLPRQAIEAMQPPPRQAPPQPAAPHRPVAPRPMAPPPPPPRAQPAPPQQLGAPPRVQPPPLRPAPLGAAPPPPQQPPQQPPRRPLPPPEDPELATRTMLDEPLEFDEVAPEPPPPSGRLFKPKTAAPKTAGDDLPSGEDIAKDVAKAKAKTKDEDEAKDGDEKGDDGPRKTKESGHFQFKTFSFRRSQLGLDALQAEEALRVAEDAAKQQAKGEDDFLDLAKQVSAAASPGEKKASGSAPSHDAASATPRFKVSGQVARPKAGALSDTNKKRLGGVAALLAVTCCLLFAPLDRLFASYEWQLHRTAALKKAKAEKKLLIEYTTDPRLRQCIIFREQVLADGKIESMRDDFVWYMEIIDTQLMPETIRYEPPYVFVYSSDGKTVLAGSRTAGELSVDGLHRLLEQAKKKAGK